MWFFSKMFPVSERSMGGFTLSVYSGPLPVWGMMRNGVVYERQMLERPIYENDGSLWPTPTASDWLNRRLPPMARIYFTANGTIRYINAAGQQSFLRTSQVMRFPTPTADDAKHITRDSGAFQSLIRAVRRFNTPVATDADAMVFPPSMIEWDSLIGDLMRDTNDLDGMAMNADWEESMLMGFPIGFSRPNGPPLLDYRLTTMSRRASLTRTPTRIGMRGWKPSATQLFRKSSTRSSSRYGNTWKRRMV